LIAVTRTLHGQGQGFRDAFRAPPSSIVLLFRLERLLKKMPGLDWYWVLMF
jgi:hypothetical protein